jgi:hypothetical protein
MEVNMKLENIDKANELDRELKNTLREITGLENITDKIEIISDEQKEEKVIVSISSESEELYVAVEGWEIWYTLIDVLKSKKEYSEELKQQILEL